MALICRQCVISGNKRVSGAGSRRGLGFQSFRGVSSLGRTGCRGSRESLGFRGSRGCFLGATFRSVIISSGAAATTLRGVGLLSLSLAETCRISFLCTPMSSMIASGSAATTVTEGGSEGCWLDSSLDIKGGILSRSLKKLIFRGL